MLRRRTRTTCHVSTQIHANKKSTWCRRWKTSQSPLYSHLKTQHVVTCCERLHTSANIAQQETTLLGPTMFRVVASVYSFVFLCFCLGSACHSLQQVMRRVCSQLSDLSAPTAFNIVRLDSHSLLVLYCYGEKPIFIWSLESSSANRGMRAFVSPCQWIISCLSFANGQNITSN